ncbi:hypothetical protein L7F22_056394 [Adiantum nelumboides]|nr:hypothetical protein [Adiantum nelumboides]
MERPNLCQHGIINNNSSPASQNSKSSGSDTSTCFPLLRTNSASDEDLQIIHGRKQRRMLSNRESARRSRLRKQQHLDELRAHVTHLTAQNRQILWNFSVASKRYDAIARENRLLHSEALKLNHQLHSLLFPNVAHILAT